MLIICQVQVKVSVTVYCAALHWGASTSQHALHDTVMYSMCDLWESSSGVALNYTEIIFVLLDLKLSKSI